MEIERSPLQDCFILKPRVFKDARGSFFESYNQTTFEEETRMQVNFVQDNQSISQKGSLRGLHLQTGDYAQAKLVRAIKGEILDVVVDLRLDSPSFKKSFSLILNDVNNYQLFVPRGFAHGFITLSETSIFGYKCDNFYNKEAEAGIIYNDKTLNIDWKLPEEDFIVSEKDLELPSLNEFLQ